MQKNTSAAVLGLLAAAAVTQAMAGGQDPAAIGVQFASDPSGVLGVVNLNGPTRTDGPRMPESLCADRAGVLLHQ